METNVILEKILNMNAALKAQHPYVLSVSKCLGYVQPKFDQEGMAMKCYKKDFNNPEGKYYQMTVEDILKAWKDKAQESLKYGSMLDDYVHLAISEPSESAMSAWKTLHNYDGDERLQVNCTGFDNFHQQVLAKTNYKVVGNEIPMYTQTPDGRFINGRLDCLLYDDVNNKLLVIDWKTTETITTENQFEEMTGPLYMMDNCNINVYTLQTFMYKKALAETYGIVDMDNIDTMICQITKTDDGKNYHVWTPAFEFNNELLNKVIDYSYFKSQKSSFRR